MNRLYFLNIIKHIPAFLIMYVQSKLIRKNIPNLPEAIEPNGAVEVAESKPFQLITIGESTVAGVGVGKHSEGFTGTLAKEMSVVLGRTISWSVYAKSGYNAKKVHREILPQIKEETADLIVVGLGGNDAFEFTAPYWWERNIRKLVSDIRTRFGNVPIAFANMPPVREFPAFSSLMHSAIGNQVDYLGAALVGLAQELENVHFDSSQLDFRRWVEENNLHLTVDDFFSDGIHPSVLTYQKWAENYSKFVLKSVSISK
ncbi:SGNH/GDSL hydrolase family protein [Flavobacteriales bacterium]|nr:SGNH/GDSL hydrolase family protein [Flavobacteriales bacterium]